MVYFRLTKGATAIAQLKKRIAGSDKVKDGERSVLAKTSLFDQHWGRPSGRSEVEAEIDSVSCDS